MLVCQQQLSLDLKKLVSLDRIPLPLDKLEVLLWSDGLKISHSSRIGWSLVCLFYQTHEVEESVIQGWLKRWVLLYISWIYCTFTPRLESERMYWWVVEVLRFSKAFLTTEEALIMPPRWIHSTVASKQRTEVLLRLRARIDETQLFFRYVRNKQPKGNSLVPTLKLGFQPLLSIAFCHLSVKRVIAVRWYAVRWYSDLKRSSCCVPD